jgi:hypothetical protein
LRKSEDAIVINTDNLSILEQVELLRDYISEKCK